MARADFLHSTTTAPALLAIAVLVAWFNALTGPFQFDDYNVIVNNPAVHAWSAWLDSMPGIRPLLKLSYTLNWLAGPGPFGFHLVNVLVHAANAILVFLLLRALRPGRGGDALPFLVAAMFALHPVQTEAVTYVSGRSVSFMSLFYLGSLVAYVRAGFGKAQGLWRIGSVLLFACALLVKETAVTLPLALLIVEAVGAKSTAMQVLRRQSLHWVVLALALLVLAMSPVYRHLLEVSLATRPVIANLMTQANAVGWLAGQLAMPWGLNVDPHLPVVMRMSGLVAAQCLAIAAVAAIGFASLRRARWLAFGILWFLLHLLPTNSLLPRLDVANDRQLYLASIGAFVLVAIAIQWMVLRLDRQWIANAIVAVALLGMGAATAHRNQAYASQVAFWEDAAAKSPRKPRVLNNLGWAYQQEGRLGDARQAYLRAIELDPGYWRARINLDVLDSPAAEGQPDGR